MRERLEEFESIPRRKFGIDLTASPCAVQHTFAVLAPGSTAILGIFMEFFPWGSDALIWLCRFYCTLDIFSMEASMDRSRWYIQTSSSIYHSMHINIHQAAYTRICIHFLSHPLSSSMPTSHLPCAVPPAILPRILLMILTALNLDITYRSRRSRCGI